SRTSPLCLARPAEGVVGPGSIVTLVYDGDTDDQAERYLVGHIEERVDDLDVVSPTAPLGAALLGATAGATVAYQAPNGELRVRVLKVETAGPPRARHRPPPTRARA